METLTGRQPRLYKHNGESLTATQWAERYDLKPYVVFHRLGNGDSIAQALRPVLKRSSYGPVMVTIRLTEEVRASLNEAAKAANCSLNEFCLRAALKEAGQ